MTTKQSRKKSGTSKRILYSVEFKLRAVKLYLEEGYSSTVLSDEMGMGRSTLIKWVKRYREEGAAGLENHPGAPRSGPKLSPAVKKKVVELKQEDPQRGARRISDLLRRFHLMKASPETVRKALKEAGLNDPPVKKKPKRNPQKPRFFERRRRSMSSRRIAARWRNMASRRRC